MAEGEIEITLKWKNENFFEMTRKPNNEDKLIIIRAEEQGNIANLWPHFEKICIETFTKDLKKIGEEMAS